MTAWRRRRVQPAWCVCVLAVVLVAAVPALAQSSGNGFLFKSPSGAVTIRAGFDRATAGSEIFSFVTDELTLRHRDFSAFTLGVDVDLTVTPRVKAVLGGGYASSTTPSEFRHFVDTDDQPVEQTTEFRRLPLAASIKVYLVDPGRAVGRFAWIPARVAPYLGAGGGAMWYRFRQVGDFVDTQTLRVFSDQFDSHGWAPMAQAFAGADVSLSPRFALAGEVRYAWAHAHMSSDFSGFDSIDLSGIAVTGGLAIRY
jgi:hypothetical protein